MIENRYDIFLSHAAEDDELAARLVVLLDASGIRVFTTGPGFPTGIWSDEVRTALEESEHFWLLLTERALNRSVYVHHEFGYFFGYHRHKDSASDIRAVGRRLRYFLQKGEGRPGMYQHLQDFPVDDFYDPISIARVMAIEIGRTFQEPENPEELQIGAFSWTGTPPEGLDDMRIVRSGSGAANDYSYGILDIDVQSPKPIFKVGAVAWHPEVSVSPLGQVPQIGSGQKQRLSLKVVWATEMEQPQELKDSYERRFPLHRPRDPGSPWAPLYITLETQSGRPWAAVAYMDVEKQAHGHPETQLLYGPNPFGWVKGRNP